MRLRNMFSETGLFFLLSLFLLDCTSSAVDDSNSSCCAVKNTPARNLAMDVILDSNMRKNKGREGMVFISGGVFTMGGTSKFSYQREQPLHEVFVSDFYMDQTEVTNAQFYDFVNSTGYVTIAERAVDWEVLKLTVPEGTLKPHDSLLEPGSLVFSNPSYVKNGRDYSQWWMWKKGANWKSPKGPGSSIEGIMNHPVVHVCYYDASAYAKWAGKRLPTEAEWEFAARGGLDQKVYPWGDDHISNGTPKANYWQGNFPTRNNLEDGFFYTAPVKFFEPNGYGLYDMAGNVWEWCSDLYHEDYYKMIDLSQPLKNPKGPTCSFDPDQPGVEKRVQKGGSFLCNDSYCASYRCSAKMPGSLDTGMPHLGFRCVSEVE